MIRLSDVSKFLVSTALVLTSTVVPNAIAQRAAPASGTRINCDQNVAVVAYVGDYLVYAGAVDAAYRVCTTKQSDVDRLEVEADTKTHPLLAMPLMCLDVSAKDIRVRRTNMVTGKFDFLYCRLPR
jgi:hypothetical protein